MPVSLSEAPPGGAVSGKYGAIDKSKFADFKPLSLDVIFHDCKIKIPPKEKLDAFARQCL